MTSERRPSLARGAAAITLATALSRLTGFVRVIVVAAALGTTFLANTYQTANSAPNLVFELLAAGVLTSVFVPTFVDHLVKEGRDAAWKAGDALTSVAVVGLAGVAALLALAAPFVMRLLTVGVDRPAVRAAEVALGTDLLRLFAPQVIFYGLGMIMTAALHAHGRFGLAAASPILNNAVVICVYLTYAAMRADRPPTLDGVTDAETVVLGAGTTLGVVAMTVVLVPQLAALGWRPRWRWDPSHPAVAKAANLGAWTLGYAGGYQAGLVVVLLLANRVEGGVAAYQWAYTFFYVPHAVFGVAIFNVLFPAMSERVARGDFEGFARRLSEGLEMLAFVLLPVALFLLVCSGLIAQTTLTFGAMTDSGARLIGRVLAAFALGLPAFSGFLVLTRACYALGDARSPALVNGLAIVLSSAAGALLFLSVPAEWRVAGLAAGHSGGFVVAVVVLARRLRRAAPVRRWLTPSMVRSAVLATVAGVAMLVATDVLPRGSRLDGAVNLAITAAVGAAVYATSMRAVRAPELSRVGALGRRGTP